MRIEERAEVGATPARVWQVAGDPARLGELEHGVLIVPELPGEPPALRSRYRAQLRVGPVPVGGEVELVEYVDGRELAWASLTGIDQRFRLRVRELDGDRTKLTLRFAYSSPGPLGIVADLASYRRVRELLRSLVRAITAQAEAPPKPAARRARRSRA